jgi:hypothetical protein
MSKKIVWYGEELFKENERKREWLLFNFHLIEKFKLGK